MMQADPDMFFIGKISLHCNRIAEKSLLLLGLLMAVIVMLQVFCRYILNHSLFWSEELARYLLVWLTFLGASVAYYRNMHPGVDVIYSRLPGSFKRYTRIVVAVLSLLFFLVMIWYGTRFAYFVRLQTTPALSLPKWTIFSVIPLSGMLLFIHGVAKLLGEFRKDGEAQ
jgi:TRAP-type C4-dicarboxylate transport system permease small subunit